jgi:hydroxyacylglutathione hydrolase
LSLSNVLARMAGGAVVLDTRDPDDFARSHLSGAVNVGLGGRFAEFAGDVLRPFDEIVLVCDPGHATEARVRLGRIGFDAVVGSFAAGGPDPFAAAPQATGGSRRIAAGELGLLLEQSGHAITVLDVRNPAELEEGCLPGAVNIALSQLTARLDSIALDRPVVVYCASGYRSSIAASVLCRHGHAEVIELLGGYQAWDDTTRAHRVGARPG